MMIDYAAMIYSCISRGLELQSIVQDLCKLWQGRARVPFIGLAAADFDVAPLFVALIDIFIAVDEHFARDGFANDIGDFFAVRPNVT